MLTTSAENKAHNAPSKREDPVPGTSIVPFLKWPGGKRWFVQHYSHLLPKRFNRYIEPFLGGGSVFFYLKPQNAILSDSNQDVINTYEAIKKNWRTLEQSLQEHQQLHSDEYYYKIREIVPVDLVSKASRILYLNRTCFNGIYRVNKKGEFNVPRGTKDSVLLDTDDFEMAASILRNATIFLSDFESVIDCACAGDFIFADPPYTVSHNSNGFVKYNEKLFSWGDQERLARALIRAKERGAKIVSTNANHPSVKELYKGAGFNLKTVTRYSSISASAESRKQFEELIIQSHPKRFKKIK